MGAVGVGGREVLLLRPDCAKAFTTIAAERVIRSSVLIALLAPMLEMFLNCAAKLTSVDGV